MKRIFEIGDLVILTNGDYVNLDKGTLGIVKNLIAGDRLTNTSLHMCVILRRRNE